MLQAPCCGKTYICRLCHNDAELHEIDRRSVVDVVCNVCGTKQAVSICTSVFIGVYSTETCSIMYYYNTLKLNLFQVLAVISLGYTMQTSSICVSTLQIRTTHRYVHPEN